jgi:hypothetical protein
MFYNKNNNQWNYYQYNYYLWQQYVLQQHNQLKSKLNNRQNDNILNISGEWNTDEGKITFNQDGNNVTGIYKFGNGKIEGKINGYILEGYWYEAPTYECPNDKGKLKFEFDLSGNTFEGNWSYCENELNRKWNGVRVQSTLALNVSGDWYTELGKMTLKQEFNRVTGTYEYGNGKIEGIISGYTLKGYWFEEPTYECPNDKGKLEFDFSSNGNTFRGVWGYCEDEPQNGWIGVRMRH